MGRLNSDPNLNTSLYSISLRSSSGIKMLQRTFLSQLLLFLLFVTKIQSSIGCHRLEETTLIKRNCKNASMVGTEENCDLTYSSCGDVGCAESDVFYNCVDQNTNLEFVLLCNIRREGRPCIMALTSGRISCRPCCRNANCGGNYFPTCKMYK